MPFFSARSNSRCVCRRPSALAYQSASSVLGRDLWSFVDFRGIDSSLSLIHGVSRDRPHWFISNREHYHQIPSSRGCTEKLPAFLAAHVFCRDDRLEPLDRFLDFPGRLHAGQYGRHCADPQSRPFTPSSTAIVYTVSVYTTRLLIQQKTARPPLISPPAGRGSRTGRSRGSHCEPGGPESTPAPPDPWRPVRCPACSGPRQTTDSGS